MKKLALVVGCLVSVMAFAADPAAADKGMDKGMMGGWTPRKVTKEDKKGIESAMEASKKAWMAGNIDEAMTMIDFPIFMMTDNKEGKVTAHMTDAATYKQMMEPMMKEMSANKEMMAAMAKAPKPKTDMFFITDTMAVVSCKGTMPMMGKEKHEMRNSMLWVNVDGKWKMKGEMEGGWGDMSMPQGSDMKAPEMKPAASAPGQTKGGSK